MAEKVIVKESLDAVEKWDAGSQTMDFVISDASVDRMGDVIDLEGWELKNYRRNPVVQFAHQYDRPAVGQATKVWTEDNKLKARVQFAPTALGQELQTLYTGRFMRATSVGFMPLEEEDREVSEEEAAKYGFHRPVHYKRQELVEFSLVPVPANANALAAAITGGLQAKAFQEALAQAVSGDTEEADEEPVEKGAISYGSAHAGGTPKADEDAAWDAGAEVKKADGAKALKRMHTWFNSEMEADEKTAYKLPHHQADGTLVWRGVSAAGNVMMGARGGVDIPEADKGGVKAHLARHYGEFDKQPPWEKEKDERPSREEMLDEFDYLHDLLRERGELSPSEQAVAKALIGELWPRAYPEQEGRETGGDIPDEIEGEDYDAVTTALDLIYQAGDHLTTVIAKRWATQGDTEDAAGENPAETSSEESSEMDESNETEQLVQQLSQALAEKWGK